MCMRQGTLCERQVSAGTCLRLYSKIWPVLGLGMKVSNIAETLDAALLLRAQTLEYADMYNVLMELWHTGNESSEEDSSLCT